LGIDRETVGRYLRLDSKPASEVPAGSEVSASQEAGSALPGVDLGTDSKPAKVPTGSGGRKRSLSARWEEKILIKLEMGLSAQRIYQDLVSEEKFAASYDSVKRFVRGLEEHQPLPFRRIECSPGEEVQVDFGQGAWVVVEGKRKRPHLFRMVLSHSRKGVSEVVWHQSTECFIRSLENAFRYFGGVTRTTVIDYVPGHIIDPDFGRNALELKETVSFRHVCGKVDLLRWRGDSVG